MAALALAGCGQSTAGSQHTFDTYRNRACPPPAGHVPADCRLAVHGTPDLSGQAFDALAMGNVTVHARVRGLARNPAVGGRRSWPLIDSFAQPMGRIEVTRGGGLRLRDASGRAYAVSKATVRGHGCAADLQQQHTHTLLQVVALKARASGTQGFVDARALDRATPSGRRAFATWSGQRRGGTGCGPPRPLRGEPRPLRNPGVHPKAHARLGGGEYNTVVEYDAKPEFGNVVYFSSNTTDVHVGGMTRGMVKVGTPVRRIDTFDYCDPNSDGTLTWDYVAIHAGGTRQMYGWIPRRCSPAGRG